jgi:hypothetical protein
MARQKQSEARDTRVGAIICIVMGLVLLVGAWRLNAQADKVQDVTSVQVLTKRRPVVGEWLFVPAADYGALSRIAGVIFVIGIGSLLLGSSGLEQAKLLGRVEKLEAEVARLSQPRSEPDTASPSAEPGKK